MGRIRKEVFDEYKHLSSNKKIVASSKLTYLFN